MRGFERLSAAFLSRIHFYLDKSKYLWPVTKIPKIRNIGRCTFLSVYLDNRVKLKVSVEEKRGRGS